MCECVCAIGCVRCFKGAFACCWRPLGHAVPVISGGSVCEQTTVLYHFIVYGISIRCVLVRPFLPEWNCWDSEKEVDFCVIRIFWQKVNTKIAQFYTSERALARPWPVVKGIQMKFLTVLGEGWCFFSSSFHQTHYGAQNATPKARELLLTLPSCWAPKNLFSCSLHNF